MNKVIGGVLIGLATATVVQALPSGPQVTPDGTPIYISGSTAFRLQVFNALGDLGLKAQTGDSSGNNIFTFNGQPNDTTIGSFEGGLPSGLTGGGHVTVYCSFDGSAQGVHECTTPSLQQNFEDLGAPGGAGVATFTSPSTLAFSDVEQDSTTFTSPTLNEIVSEGANSTGTFQGVAVQPFLWAADSYAAAKITSMNNDQAFNLFNSGANPLCFWTGVAADSSTLIKLTGRDNTSGSRITAEANTPYGLTTPIIQWTVNGTVGTPGSTGNVGAWALAPGDSYGGNDSGYGSGGNVAKALGLLGVPGTDTSLVVGYVSFSDALGLVDSAKLNTGATLGTALTYDNISPVVQLSPFEYNISAVENGSYPYWSYEHLFLASDVSTSSYAGEDLGPGLVTAVCYEISLQTATSPQTAILEDNMNVQRIFDGGPVTHF